MKIAVLAQSRDHFNYWYRLLDQRNKCEFIYVSEPEKALGRTFDLLIQLEDWDKDLSAWKRDAILVTIMGSIRPENVDIL